MQEIWLDNSQVAFQHLIFNTFIEYPLCVDKEEALQYLRIINSSDFFYNSFSNYNIIDFEKIIYIDEIYKTDEEIQNLLLKIKSQIARAYIYKNQYLKRISDFIPREQFDSIYDNYMVDAFQFPNPLKEKGESKKNDSN